MSKTHGLETTTRIYDYVAEYICQHNESPTRRQIVTACELSSTSIANYHLRKLERARLLTIGDDGKPMIAGYRLETRLVRDGEAVTE